PQINTLKTAPAPHQHGSAWDYTLSFIEHLDRILAVISPTRTDSTAAAFDVGMLAMQLDRFRVPLQRHLTQTWPNERPHQALLRLGALLLHFNAQDSADPDNEQPLERLR